MNGGENTVMLTLTKEEYRELKKHGRLEKDGCVYRQS
jgi:hypothetical protein